MKFSFKIKPISYFKNYKGQKEALVLLQVLVLGNREIEEDKFYDIEKVFIAFDKELSHKIK